MADVMCDCDETYEFAGGRVHCRTCGASWEPLVVTPEATVLPPLAPCDDCGGPWKYTGLNAPGPETIHACAGRAALPQDSAERKRTPLCTGCVDYFPAALDSLCAYTQTKAGDPDDIFDALSERRLDAVVFLALETLQFELTGELPDYSLVEGTSDMFRQYAESFAAVAQVSWYGNAKHNPGQPLHHARGKSMDHFDCIARHYVERGGFDGPMRHSACLLWRALAARQEELESMGAPLARGAVLP